MNKILTKSDFLTGLKCPKSLWIMKNKPEILPELDLSTKYRFKVGNQVGELAKKYFENGYEVKKDDNLNELLKQNKILFEPPIKYERLYSRADILVPIKNNEYDIVEVKSGTKVKDENIYDVAFQKYVYEKYGIKIRNCYLMHINNKYEREGKLDLKELFTIEDITKEVLKISHNIEDNINSLLDIIDQEDYTGNHCENPKECPLPNLDWDFLTDNSVFSLYNIRVKKALEYYNSGYLDITQIPDSIKLNPKQKIQKDCIINNQIHLDKKGINIFLNTLKYPLYYIDFETYSPAIPIYDGMKPYQRIPFQFSLHIQNAPNEELIHKEFLADGDKDPREEFILKIKEFCNDKGSIITFNKSFEKGVLKECVSFLSQHEEWFESIDDRLIDLLDVFRNFDYYNPKQQGSCSIKKVLPSIYPEKNHKDLEISDGMSASIEYERTIIEELEIKEIEKIRKNLLEYCCLDTLAMVHIKEELEKLQ